MHHSVEFLPDTISFWLPGHKADQTKARGFFATGAYIMQRKTPLALYKGLGAVLSGIVPKMATRFASFEAYKSWLMDKETRQISPNLNPKLRTQFRTGFNLRPPQLK